MISSIWSFLMFLSTITGNVARMSIYSSNLINVAKIMVLCAPLIFLVSLALLEWRRLKMWPGCTQYILNCSRPVILVQTYWFPIMTPIPTVSQQTWRFALGLCQACLPYSCSLIGQPFFTYSKHILIHRDRDETNLTSGWRHTLLCGDYDTEVWVSSDLAVALIQERSKKEEQVLGVSVFRSVCCGSN